MDFTTGLTLFGIGLGLVVALFTMKPMKPVVRVGLLGFGVVLMVVGLFGLGWNFHSMYELRLPFASREAKDSKSSWGQKPLVQVWNKTFKGETVKLDGYEYVNCTFDDVTLEYNGTAPARFDGKMIVRQPEEKVVTIKSSNKIVQQTMLLMIGLHRALGAPERAFAVDFETTPGGND